MRKTALVAVIAFLVGASVSAAATPWKVFATGRDTGSGFAFASANADAPRSHALAIRATSKGAPLKVLATLSCLDNITVKSGAVVVLTPWLFKKCSVGASASTDDSVVKVELLRR